jgi:type 1 glutamine amidotransferase
LIHPTVYAQTALKKVLQRIENVDIIQKRTLAFHNLIEKYQPRLIILYYHEKNIAPIDLSALINFVNQGGAVLAIHSASASFKQEALYHDLLGGRFINHGPVQRYKIEFVENNRRRIFTQQDPYCIKDELYLHENKEEVNIVMTTALADHNEPVAWTKCYGKGRIAYFAPGHRTAIFHNPKIQTSILSLIKWSLNEE